MSFTNLKAPPAAAESPPDATDKLVSSAKTSAVAIDKGNEDLLEIVNKVIAEQQEQALAPAAAIAALAAPSPATAPLRPFAEMDEQEQERLLDAVRKVFREELGKLELHPAREKTAKQLAGDVDEGILGFLRALQEEDDMT